MNDKRNIDLPPTSYLGGTFRGSGLRYELNLGGICADVTSKTAQEINEHVCKIVEIV
jgi:hypothetical protein